MSIWSTALATTALAWWVALASATETTPQPSIATTGKLFLGSCPDAERGCFFGLLGVTMHRGSGDACREKCVLFPALKRRYTCGACSVDFPVPAPTPGYDITQGFDSVPATDVALFTTATARWERIIVSDFDDLPSASLEPYAPNCVFPTVIDDMYLCVTYGTLSEGGDVVGIGGYEYTRPTGTVVAGFIKLKRSEVSVGKEQGWLPNVILHEIGHSLGIGLLGECPNTNANSNANREYQALSGCTTKVPLEDDCGHFQEDCLAGELMTPIVDTTSYISRMSVGWLQDVGYQVDYSASDTEYTASMLGTNPRGSCKCNRRGAVRHLEVDVYGSSRVRRLSDEGYQAAVAYGQSHLAERAARHARSGAQTYATGVEFVGDRAVVVMYREGEHIHSVTVQRER